ncbi:dihydroorotate dehydrogenase electron transfer subunit [Eubacterium xylanophilum]|uniref:dihydroorotate dehydrogenase electron transfer subunit n=1 Tax=Eubacterium xylanophilum TaxID=39497 RepID=UPI0004B6264E|nr:dihydroorotate dehydrogenase electron transfer subunit [Eubacterium xylanophilum]
MKCKCLIRESIHLTADIYSLRIVSKEMAEQAKPGQFVSLYCGDHDNLLPRPISICEIGEDELRLVYRVVGKGTKEFSGLKAGDEIEVMGPLGNGFPVEGEAPILVGGGIGIPPMLELAKRFEGKATVVLGYRDADNFLLEDFEKVAKVYIATDDGSVGTHGTVVDAMKENVLTGDRVYSCGPTPMLRGIKAFGLENDIKTYISMEEKMACGIGACLACVCNSTEVDGHSKVKNKRICKDGPVFLSTDVEP